MPVYSCGFNEFGQVSSASSDQKRGFIALPMVIKLQRMIGTVRSKTQKTAKDDKRQRKTPKDIKQRKTSYLLNFSYNQPINVGLKEIGLDRTNITPS